MLPSGKLGMSPKKEPPKTIRTAESVEGVRIINRGPKNGLHLVVIIGVWKGDKFSAAIDKYVKGFDFQRKPVSLIAVVGTNGNQSTRYYHQEGNRMQVGAQKNTSSFEKLDYTIRCLGSAQRSFMNAELRALPSLAFADEGRVTGIVGRPPFKVPVIGLGVGELKRKVD
ncbi:hypothetical protein TNCV_4386681 [Trichonephila clavipes]|nr:hypothetical protein TNCV_4386681 [Trichonephila clavipes]